MSFSGGKVQAAANQASPLASSGEFNAFITIKNEGLTSVRLGGDDVEGNDKGVLLAAGEWRTFQRSDGNPFKLSEMFVRTAVGTADVSFAGE